MTIGTEYERSRQVGESKSIFPTRVQIITINHRCTYKYVTAYMWTHVMIIWDEISLLAQAVSRRSSIPSVILDSSVNSPEPKCLLQLGNRNCIYMCNSTYDAHWPLIAPSERLFRNMYVTMYVLLTPNIISG